MVVVVNDLVIIVVVAQSLHQMCHPSHEGIDEVNVHISIPPKGNCPCAIQYLVPADRPPTAFSLPHKPDGPPAAVIGRYNRVVHLRSIAQAALMLMYVDVAAPVRCCSACFVCLLVFLSMLAY